MITRAASSGRPTWRKPRRVSARITRLRSSQFPGWTKISNERAAKATGTLRLDPAAADTLLDPVAEDLSAYQGNIENAIGLLKIPVGIAGPLRVNGLSAKGDFPIPLATTEAALVASYHRGCRAINAAGGCSAIGAI